MLALNHERPTTACKWCGAATPMLGTRMCDRCWELDRRVASDPSLAFKMLCETSWWQQIRVGVLALDQTKASSVERMADEYPVAEASPIEIDASEQVEQQVLWCEPPPAATLYVGRVSDPRARDTVREALTRDAELAPAETDAAVEEVEEEAVDPLPPAKRKRGRPRKSEPLLSGDTEGAGPPAVKPKAKKPRRIPPS
jgi:hypothetical protein